MPLPYQAIPPLMQNGVCTVQASAGGSADDGVVSWRLQGHWYLNQAGYAAIFSQITTYFANRATNPANTSGYPNNTSVTQTEVTNTSGAYSVANGDLQTQATAIFDILTTTWTNLSGGF